MPPDLVSPNAKKGFPCGSDRKESTCNARDQGSIPRSGSSPGEGNGNSLQYSCLENSMDRRSLAGYSPWGCKESDMTEQLHLHFLSMQKCRLPRWLSSKESACNAAAAEMRVRALGQEDPLEEGMATHSAFLPGKSHGQRNLAGYSP